MKAICVSGTPGTGKTTYAKKLAKEKRYKYIDVNKIIEKNNLVEEFDENRDTNVVDVDKLNKILVELIKESAEKLVIDSHLSHYLLPEVVEKVIITKCDLKELQKRLEKRGYSKEKVRENMDAEIFDTCRIEAIEAGHTVEVVWSDKKTA